VGGPDLQEYIRQVTTYQNVAHSSKIIALLSDIRLYPSTFTMGSMPAIAAAAAAAGGSDASSLDVLSMGITSANVKSRYAGEIAGMKRLYSVSMSSLMLSEVHGFKTHSGGRGLNGIGSIHSGDDEEGSLQSILISRFMQQLQQFVIDAQQGCSISDVKYRDACLQAAALLLSEMVWLLVPTFSPTASGL
jgi:phosphatidylinositol 4-kinase